MNYQCTSQQPARTIVVYEDSGSPQLTKLLRQHYICIRLIHPKLVHNIWSLQLHKYTNVVHMLPLFGRGGDFFHPLMFVLLYSEVLPPPLSLVVTHMTELEAASQYWNLFSILPVS